MSGKRLSVRDELLTNAFNKYDIDRSGSIDSSELVHIVQDLELSCDAAGAEAITTRGLAFLDKDSHVRAVYLPSPLPPPPIPQHTHTHGCSLGHRLLGPTQHIMLAVRFSRRFASLLLHQHTPPKPTRTRRDRSMWRSFASGTRLRGRTSWRRRTTTRLSGDVPWGSMRPVALV